jgi:hypothetical protein
MPWCKHLSRVPVEGDPDRSHTSLASALHGASQNLPVPQMNAVEEADGDDARLLLERKRLDPIDDLHGRGAYLTIVALPSLGPLLGPPPGMQG